MTDQPIPRPDCWAPVPTTWRYVRGGDVLAARKTAALLLVLDTPAPTKDGRLSARVVAAPNGEVTYLVDVDDPVTVLRAIAERDAGTLLAAELGARLIDERSAA